jgi:Uncharacterised nucleotidyltransferase
MDEFNRQQNHWITWQQELLLKAALFSGNDAISAWEKWKKNVDFDSIDPGSYRLLPLLYHNLIKLKINDALMNRLKGIYRRTWYENQIRLNRMVMLLELFQNSGIKTIVLKGIALIHLFYKDYGLRPMSDLDIFVPTKHAAETIVLLKKLGWETEYKSPEKIIDFFHSCDLTDTTGLHHLDLHWHLFIECCGPNADDDFWDGAQPTMIKNISTNVLNPADQLLHTCVHGMKWSKIPPFRWVADALMILNSSQTEIDWNRLINQAQKCSLTVPLKYSLEYLVKSFNVFISPENLEKIREIPATKVEQIEYKYKIENQKKKLLGNIPVLWFDSLRLSGNKSLLQKLRVFIKYLKHFWKIENSWQLSTYVLSMSVNKIKHLIK